MSGWVSRTVDRPRRTTVDAAEGLNQPAASDRRRRKHAAASLADGSVSQSVSCVAAAAAVVCYNE